MGDRAGNERYRGRCYNVSHELGTGAKHRRTADYPENTAGLGTIDQRDRGVGGSCQGRADLEHPPCVGVPLGVKGERPGEAGGRAVVVDSRYKGFSAEVTR